VAAIGAEMADAAAPAQVLEVAEQAVGPVEIVFARGPCSASGLRRDRPGDRQRTIDVNLLAPLPALPARTAGDARPRLGEGSVHLLGGRVHRRDRRGALRGVEGRPAARPRCACVRAGRHGQRDRRPSDRLPDWRSEWSCSRSA
jgi:hypothetical protein